MVLTSVNRTRVSALVSARARQYNRTHGVAPKKLSTELVEFDCSMESWFIPSKIDHDAVDEILEDLVLLDGTMFESGLEIEEEVFYTMNEVA